MSKLVGVFILGVLAGWLAEWIFVRLFVPNPKKKLEAALQSSRKEIQTLQQKNSELQSALSTAQASPAPVQVVVQETVAEPEPVAVEAIPEEPVLQAAEPAVPVVETALVAEAESASDGKDDLTRLNGIGPKLAEAMDAAGINRYTQLAALSVEEVNGRLAASGIRYSKVTAESWAAQAQLASAGDWDGLKNYQASLKS